MSVISIVQPHLIDFSEKNKIFVYTYLEMICFFLFDSSLINKYIEIDIYCYNYIQSSNYLFIYLEEKMCNSID